MFDLNKIQDNAIIITPNSIKKDILLETNKLDFDIKFMSKEELEQNTFFTYGDDAIAFVMGKGYSYANAKEILSNLYYLKEGTGSNKIDELIAIKKELDDSKLLKYNPVFKYLFLNKKVYVYHYSSKDRELENLLLLNEIKAEYLEDEVINDKFDILEFDDINDEVNYVFNEIAEMVSRDINPIDINKIKLLSYSSDYDLVINKFVNFYGLPLNKKSQMNLFDSPYFNKFITYYKELTLEEAFAKISDDFKNADHYNFVPTLKNLLFKVNGLFEEKEDQITYLTHLAKDKKLSLCKYENGIDIVDQEYVNDDHIFLLGFNLMNYPTISRDTDFLTDKEKALLGINTSIIENDIKMEKLLNFLHTHSKLHLSYKKYINGKQSYPSLLINELKMNIVTDHKIKTYYSEKALANIVGVDKDYLRLYNIKHSLYDIEKINNKEIGYYSYDNSFKSFKGLEKDSIKFSYTQIKEYNQCPFRYYVNRYLKLNLDVEIFTGKFGSFCHEILQEMRNDPTLTISDFISNIDTLFNTATERHLALNLMKNLQIIIDNNKMMLQQTKKYATAQEKGITIKLADNITLEGRIDSLIFYNGNGSKEDNDSMIIVDYKTNDESIDKNKVQFGLSLQLPIYSLLIKNSDEKKDTISWNGNEKPLKKYQQAGLYIQNIIGEVDDAKYGKLAGLSINELNELLKFDFGLTEIKYSSKYFCSVSTDSNGKLGNKSKNIVSKEEWDSIIDLCEQKVIETANNIMSGKFDISPYFYDKKDTGCKYCPHKSICNLKPSDFRYLKESKEEEGE